MGRLRLNVLWPPDAGAPGEDPNFNAVVLVASYLTTDVFLSADAESDVTARLPLPPVEIMKVAHHGSEDPGLADELETLRPRVAVISCGRNNDYGHPRPETLAALAGRRVSRSIAPIRTAASSSSRTAGASPFGLSGNVGAVADAPDKPVYLITGSDRPKIETALTRLRGHFEPEAIESVSALDTSGEAKVGLCNAGSLFGDARLLVVTGRRWSKQTTRDVARAAGKRRTSTRSSAYLATPAPATVLALAAERPEGDLGAVEGLREGGRGPRVRRQEGCTGGWQRQFQPTRRARRSRMRSRR